MRVYDDGLHLDQHPFVVAEYLPNTLFDRLRTRPTMMEKLRYSLQLLSALNYLAGDKIAIVHRDIKPANVFIKGGSCVLGDFGLMKRQRVDVNIDREMVKASFGPRMPRRYRTPDLIAYMQGGDPPTGQSDVYQVGLVLAEIFSGSNPQVPMGGSDFAEPIRLKDFTIDGDMGEMLRGAIRPMLEADPANRPTSADALAQWQELFLEAAKRSLALEGRVI